MPGMDGLQTCAALLAHVREAGRSMPTWLMTAAFAVPAEKRARAIGAVALLSKPFDYDEFAADLERHLAERSKPRSPAPASLQTRPKPDDIGS